MGFIDNVRLYYRQSGMLAHIIFINVGVFLLVRVAAIVVALSGGEASLLPWLAVPAQPMMLIVRPWTLITYSFTHYDLWHILFNMLWLYWLGRVFMEYFTPKHFVGLYLLGALGGAALYAAVYYTVPALQGNTTGLVGASAAVMAIVVAMAVYVPDYPVGLLFFGTVALKWVVLVMILLSVLSSGLANLGGTLAHAGGALVGVWFAVAWRHGHDITAWLNKAIDSLVGLFRHRQHGVGAPVGGKAWRQRHAGNGTDDSMPSEAEVDRVLDKIRRSGYDSLNQHERDILFRASRR